MGEGDTNIAVTRFRSPLRLRDIKRVTPVLMTALALLVAACGSGAGDGTTTTTTETSTDVIETTTTTTVTATTTTSPAATTTTLAGEPIEFGPADGDVVMVVGVRHDDVLNLRAAPGADQPIRDEIPPTYDTLVAQGNTRDLSPGLWIEVDYDGSLGWVNMAFTAFEGATTDETSTVVDELGERPVEPTMTALGETVADVFDSDEESQSDTVQVTEVAEGDLAEVTYDVIGLGDDAVLGFRLHVFAEETNDGFTLSSVEATILCARSVTDDGACV
jgi:hypothetical protein